MAQLKATPPVAVAGGKVSGSYEDAGQIAVFKGIPYAKPPIGEWRWKPPQPVAPWEGVREATAYSPTALQLAVGFKTFMGALVEGQGWGAIKTMLVKLMFSVMPSPKESEDCLYLNVRTPALDKGAKLPVMVWIHGGDHTDGSGSDIFYTSNALAQRGVVFVSINYRLGLMGYFAHPQLSEESEHNVSSNYGTLDQIAALRWVQENVSSFGGDPDNVTIFGESAGGESVAHMLTSPLARGLFHKAIMQSPGNSGQMIYLKRPFLHHPAAEALGESFASKFAPAGENQLAALRQVPAAQLYKLYRQEEETFKFLPAIDGYVLEKSPFEAFLDGDQAPVPILLGSNSDEGTLLYALSPTPLVEYENKEIKASDVAGLIRETFGDDSDALFGLYPGLKEGTAAASKAIFGDSMFGAAVHFYALHGAKRSQPVYMYFFTRTPPSPKQTVGAYHAAELTFVHGSRMPLFPVTDADIVLTRAMGDYWTQFAKTGNPNVSSHPEWPVFDPDEKKYMRLGIGADLGATGIERAARYAILQRRRRRQIEQMKGMRAESGELARAGD